MSNVTARTELIPCSACGAPRPVAVRYPYEQAKAAGRRCPGCAYLARERREPPPRAPVVVELIPCPQCGIGRPITIYHQQARDRAVSHPCPECAQRNRGGEISPADQVVIRRMLHGYSPVGATPAERYAVIVYLTERNLSARVIADRLSCTVRTVERHREKIRMQSRSA